MSTASTHNAKTADPGGVLHNMSSPPRSIVNVTALLADTAEGCSASGLRTVGCFNFLAGSDAVVPRPVLRSLLGDKGRNGTVRIRKPMRAALAVARAVDGVVLGDEELASYDTRTTESLEDEVLARVGSWDLDELDLPPLGFVAQHPWDEDAYHPLPIDRSPKRTLAVLAHQRGRMFLRDERPIGFALQLYKRHHVMVPRIGRAP